MLTECILTRIRILVVVFSRLYFQYDSEGLGDTLSMKF